MQYIADRREAYADPGHVLDGVRSLVMLGMRYCGNGANNSHKRHSRPRSAVMHRDTIDYHDLIRDRLHILADTLRELVPTATTRGVVDTAPLLEREFAQLAGLGWVGKTRCFCQASRKLFLSGRAAHRRDTRIRCALPGRSLRNLHGLPGCVSDGCFSTAVCAGCFAMH